jgi:hypothetical protein
MVAVCEPIRKDSKKIDPNSIAVRHTDSGELFAVDLCSPRLMKATFATLAHFSV